ncbi:AmmeMemoRadiSam system radical SAM enzyme [Romboutsia sp.]|uniref:AmmeMemoRadiSam system radical SAM enzyme n=1 Tax=Romboutsia sp. TaxID=1965302 RepID=UPI002B574AC9|nr:AmmeMemoRadiSam system radical SAM enzyme [Romboutsia sp.]HSQ90000.1 AmmeMemoRadiSam system radical SAM enzyme [Romboutsia sp.]
MIKEASYYEKIDKNNVWCKLCPHNCKIPCGKSGICIARKAIRDENEDTILINSNYKAITSLAIDPIEKKPLYHFYPGTNILSVGTFGCNFKCSFCQNYSISQQEVPYKNVSSEELVETILSIPNNIGIAFTYNEPFIWYEYVLETAKLLKEKSKQKKVALVTNGYVSKEPLEKLLPYIDAMNIDLKGNDDYYKSLCKGSLNPVLQTIEIAYKTGCHIEVTTLLVTDENTDEKSLVDIRDFLSNLNPNIPLHISRYFPRYKQTSEATSLEVMKKAYDILKEKLNNVYIGNVSEEEKKYIIS